MTQKCVTTPNIVVHEKGQRYARPGKELVVQNSFIAAFSVSKCCAADRERAVPLVPGSVVRLAQQMSPLRSFTQRVCARFVLSVKLFVILEAGLVEKGN